MKILRPVPHIINQKFGKRPKFYKQFGMKGHNGLDFKSPKGYPIKACDKGIVVYSDYNDGYGKRVKLRHNWGESIYAHLEKRLVKKGAKVKKGQKIGLVDNTGVSSGNHLHFGIRVNPINYNNGYYGWVDPLPYLRKEKKVSKLTKQEQGWLYSFLKNLAFKNWKKTYNIAKKWNREQVIKHLPIWARKKRAEINKLKKKLELCNKKFTKLTLWEKFQLLFK